MCDLSTTESIIYGSFPRRKIVDSSLKQKELLSFGLLSYSKDYGKYLLIKARSSTGINYILYGAYRPTDLKQLLLLLYKKEIEKIVSIIKANTVAESKDLFKELYNEITGEYPLSSYALKRILDSKDYIIWYRENHTNKEYLYGIPKGKGNHKEKGIDASIREFKEETGIEVQKEWLYKHPLEIIDNSIDRNYKLRVWVLVTDKKYSGQEILDIEEIESKHYLSFTKENKEYMDDNTIALINKFESQLLNVYY
jgi:ADP-ribose pyrophosphatase YjhB (NUDIX family)